MIVLGLLLGYMFDSKLLAPTTAEIVRLWVMTEKGIGYGVLARYGRFANFPDHRFGGPKYLWGFTEYGL